MPDQDPTIPPGNTNVNGAPTGNGPSLDPNVTVPVGIDDNGHSGSALFI